MPTTLTIITKYALFKIEMGNLNTRALVLTHVYYNEIMQKGLARPQVMSKLEAALPLTVVLKASPINIDIS